MRAPIFDDSKFAVLSKDLNGPLAWLRKQSVLKRISEAEEKVNNLASTMLSGNGLLDRILNDIAVQENIPDYKERRREILRDLAQKYAEISQKKALHYPVSTGNVLMQLRSLYAVVDVEQLKSDFSAEFAGVETFDPNKSIADLEFEIELCYSEISRFWPQSAEEFGVFFQSGKIPSMWEGRRVGPPSDPNRNAHAASLVEAIMIEFFGAWRARQSNFAQKVTLGGILIHTLPDDIRPQWEALFAAYKMQTGRPVFQPLIHDTFAQRNKSKPQNKMFDRSE